MNANRTFVLLIFACLLATAPSFCRAAVFERDWKVPGDGLLTYDDVNQREWLDLSETILFDAGGVDGVLAELTPNGRFEGFDVAKSDEVLMLAESAGIDVSTDDGLANFAATDALIQLLSRTLNPGAGRSQTIGLVDEFALPSLQFPDQRMALFFSDSQRNLGGVGTSSVYSSLVGSIDRASTVVGVYLVRVVPEPCSWCLSLAAACSLLLTRRRAAGPCAMEIGVEVAVRKAFASNNTLCTSSHNNATRQLQ